MFCQCLVVNVWMGMHAEGSHVGNGQRSIEYRLKKGFGFGSCSQRKTIVNITMSLHTRCYLLCCNG